MAVGQPLVTAASYIIGRQEWRRTASLWRVVLLLAFHHQTANAALRYKRVGIESGLIFLQTVKQLTLITQAVTCHWRTNVIVTLIDQCPISDISTHPRYGRYADAESMQMQLNNQELKDLPKVSKNTFNFGKGERLILLKMAECQPFWIFVIIYCRWTMDHKQHGGAT